MNFNNIVDPPKTVDEADVLTRVGDNKASRYSWSMSTDSQATFHRKAIGFLQEFLKLPLTMKAL